MLSEALHRLKILCKTDVWALSRYRNALAVERGETPPIPERSITKEPSAELRPDQKDSDSLPDYPLLDQVLRAYVDEDHGYEALACLEGSEPELVRSSDCPGRQGWVRKRRQYPPGTRGFRLEPLAQIAACRSEPQRWDES